MITSGNDGTVTIKDKRTIEVTKTGQIAGSGSLVVEAGGKVINSGKNDITTIWNGKEQTVKSGESYTNTPKLYVTAVIEKGEAFPLTAKYPFLMAAALHTPSPRKTGIG